MKKLYFKNIKGNNPRKREISIEEVSQNKTAQVSKKWICKYFVKEKYASGDVENLRNWISMEKRRKCRKDCHILREYNSKTGDNKVVCKVLGDFFVINGGTVYKIVYVNEVKIQVLANKGSKRRIK